jgi:hypothetical protein
MSENIAVGSSRRIGRPQRLRTTCPLQGTVEWRFAHLAKQEVADKEESAATVLGGEPLLAGVKPSTKSLKKGSFLQTIPTSQAAEESPTKGRRSPITRIRQRGLDHMLFELKSLAGCPKQLKETPVKQH